MPTPLQLALDSLRQRGGSLPPSSRAAVERSLQQYSGVIADNTIQELLDAFFAGLREIQKPKQNLPPGETGETPGSLRGKMTSLLRRYEDPQSIAGTIDFKIDVAQRVATGAGKFVADQANVEAYPAWELEREYERDVPRGFRRGAGGELVPVPDDDWPSRFTAACEAAGDDEALRVLQETGRMIALKSSGVWAQLGHGAGGYTDTLGNPFAPFAFNSGYRTNGVHRTETIELGLLRTDEKPKGSDFDFSQLISLPA